MLLFLFIFHTKNTSKELNPYDIILLLHTSQYLFLRGWNKMCMYMCVFCVYVYVYLFSLFFCRQKETCLKFSPSKNTTILDRAEGAVFSLQTVVDFRGPPSCDVASFETKGKKGCDTRAQPLGKCVTGSTNEIMDRTQPCTSAHDHRQIALPFFSPLSTTFPCIHTSNCASSL